MGVAVQPPENNAVGKPRERSKRRIAPLTIQRRVPGGPVVHPELRSNVLASLAAASGHIKCRRKAAQMPKRRCNARHRRAAREQRRTTSAARAIREQAPVGARPVAVVLRSRAVGGGATSESPKRRHDGATPVTDALLASSGVRRPRRAQYASATPVGARPVAVVIPSRAVGGGATSESPKRRHDGATAASDSGSPCIGAVAGCGGSPLCSPSSLLTVPDGASAAYCSRSAGLAGSEGSGAVAGCSGFPLCTPSSMLTAPDGASAAYCSRSAGLAGSEGEPVTEGGTRGGRERVSDVAPASPYGMPQSLFTKVRRAEDGARQPSSPPTLPPAILGGPMRWVGGPSAGSESRSLGGRAIGQRVITRVVTSCGSYHP